MRHLCRYDRGEADGGELSDEAGLTTDAVVTADALKVPLRAPSVIALDRTTKS